MFSWKQQWKLIKGVVTLAPISDARSYLWRQRFLSWCVSFFFQAMPLYWSYSSLFGLIQNIIMDYPSVKRRLGVPVFPTDSNTPVLARWNRMKDRFGSRKRKDQTISKRKWTWCQSCNLCYHCSVINETLHSECSKMWNNYVMCKINYLEFFSIPSSVTYQCSVLYQCIHNPLLLVVGFSYSFSCFFNWLSG